MNGLLRKVLVLVLGLLLAQAGHAAAPPLSGPGRLTAEQLRQLTQLVEKGNRAGAASDFEEVEKAKRRIVLLRERWQGKHHWETIDAWLEVEEWQRLTQVPARERRQVVGALAANNEGARLQASGRYREAETKFREALTICRTVLGEDHPTTATFSDNLATCRRYQGKHADALPLHRKALAISRKALGEKHPHTASRYDSLALCSTELGKHADALPLHRKALTIRRESLGEEHPDTASSYGNLALCLHAQGKLTEALPLDRKALAIRRKVLGEEHLHTALSYGNLAAVLSELGRHSEAHPLSLRALAIRRRALGEEHPYTADSTNNLAFCLSGQGKDADALPLFRKALTIRRKVLGEEHPDTSISYNNLAACLDRQGKYAEALPLLRKALAISRRVSGEGHPRTATQYDNLAACLFDLGRHGEAYPLARKALQIRRKTLGEKHPATATSYDTLAMYLHAQGKHADALALNLEALQIRRQVFGEGHLLTARSCDTLAAYRGYQGKHAESLVFLRRSLQIRRKALGEDHPATASSYSNLGVCLSRQGKHTDALPLLRKALAIRRKVLGEEHPDTALAYGNLGLCLRDQGRLSEAVLVLQASLPAQEAARFHSAPSGFDRAVAARRLSPHLWLALALAQLNQPGNAFRHAEAFLARGLLDDLAHSDPGDARRIETLSAHLGKLDDRFISLLAREKLSEDQQRLLDELRSQRGKVTSELARLASAASARQLASLKEIQSVLPADAALVLWLDLHPGGPHWACVVRSLGPPAWVQLTGSGKAGAWTADDLSLAVRCWRGLRDPVGTRAECSRLLAELRAQRLRPLQRHLAATDRLPSVRHLFVVPAGIMAYLPVEALAPDCTVSLIPSGSMLVRLLRRHRQLRGDNLLALGDPVFSPPSSKPPEPPSHGVLLKAVLPGSPAARAGLQAGDVLLSINGRRLESATDLTAALVRVPALVVYWREGAQGKARLSDRTLGAVVDERSARAAVRAWRRDQSALALRGTGHRPLPGSAHEVNALAALVKNTTKLTGSAASEQELDRLVANKRLERFHLLHFATHGEVDERAPDRCRLILAQDRLPNPATLEPGQKACTGELTVKAIRQGWRLDADLVVLSACQTALGKRAEGDGLLGFAHAFLARGARAVVLSRWKVDDGATALLMVRFYENLLGSRKASKRMGRARALQEAKDWLRTLSRRQAEQGLLRLTGGTLRGTEIEGPPIAVGKKPVLPKGDRPYEHPFYWAAFLLGGDPD